MRDHARSRVVDDHIRDALPKVEWCAERQIFILVTNAHDLNDRGGNDVQRLIHLGRVFAENSDIGPTK